MNANHAHNCPNCDGLLEKTEGHIPGFLNLVNWRCNKCEECFSPRDVERAKPLRERLLFISRPQVPNAPHCKTCGSPLKAHGLPHVGQTGWHCEFCLRRELAEIKRITG